MEHYQEPLISTTTELEKALNRAQQELVIEAAMDRIRTVALSMRTADELLNICSTLFKELRELGFEDLRNAMINIHHDDEAFFLNYDYSGSIGASIAKISYDDPHPAVKKYLRQIRTATDAFADFAIEGRDMDDWKEFRKKTGQRDDPKLDTAQALYYYFYSIGVGALGISTFTAATDDQLNILRRFRNIFEFAYRRYMDLSFVEAQAREAKIEAALETVRGRIMGMQRSDELQDIARVLFQQFNKLGQTPLQITIGIFREPDEQIEFRISDRDGGESPFNRPLYGSIHEPTLLSKIYAAWKGKKRSAVIALTGRELLDWIAYRGSLSGIHDTAVISDDRRVMCAAFFSSGLLSFSAAESLPEGSVQLLERFAAVFDLGYTRFLDLQEAEARAREAHIEAALERVRSVAMSMNTPADLPNVCEALFNGFRALGFNDLRNAMINIHDDEKSSFINYDYSEVLGKSITPLYYTIHPVIEKQIKQIRTAPDAFSETVFSGKELEEWKEFRRNSGEKEDPRLQNSDALYYYFYSIGTGSIGISTFHPVPEDGLILLKRFRNVFDFAYRRYLDIVQAQAHARETQVELSLERVRARSMAMRSSTELVEASDVLFEQLRTLGIESLRTGVGNINGQDETIEIWSRSHTEGQAGQKILGVVPKNSHPFWSGYFDAWKRKEKYFCYECSGDEVARYYRAMEPWLSYPQPTGYHPREVFCSFFFPEGSLNVVRRTPLGEEELRLLQRFANVFGLMYRRFLDLQKVEAQAREAQIETSLERVRGRTLAMQKSDELAETAAVLFKQLIALGIEPNRLYIGLVKDNEGNAEFWITDEDGSKVTSGFSADLNDNESFRKMYEGWKARDKSQTIDMQGEELEEYFRYLSRLQVPFKGGLSQKRRVQTIAFFSHGFIGLASPDPQPQETIDLLQRFAYVCNLTFTRFNDLKLAEAQAHQAQLDLIQLQEAKKRAEEALSELRATQEQLVQREKLASLGQLTAGIAHEIKNPLNFVTNFSALSLDMVDEVLEARKGKKTLSDEEVTALLDDVKMNLTKINEHGTRADGIVKSMLHHSRGGTGKMEPTDLNAVIKEYVNLAYHGMRAGKNPISPSIELELDGSVGKTGLMAEEFSRVIVNLCQNAFDAMREKLSVGDGKPDTEHYVPKLIVRSQRGPQGIIVEVEDNGPGIPQGIKDKVMQPFFTTKRGTQGTGLGLSITHDIVSAHRGTITFCGNQDRGTTFTITLPATPGN